MADANLQQPSGALHDGSSDAGGGGVAVGGGGVCNGVECTDSVQPEIQSEILASIRGLQGEMQELRALVSDLHVQRDRAIACEP